MWSELALRPSAAYPFVSAGTLSITHPLFEKNTRIHTVSLKAGRGTEGELIKPWKKGGVPKNIFRLEP
jgi:hypothetical protein